VPEGTQAGHVQIPVGCLPAGPAWQPCYAVLNHAHMDRAVSSQLPLPSEQLLTEPQVMALAGRAASSVSWCALHAPAHARSDAPPARLPNLLELIGEDAKFTSGRRRSQRPLATAPLNSSRSCRRLGPA
jgi:hypothetical protein